MPQNVSGRVASAKGIQKGFKTISRSNQLVTPCKLLLPGRLMPVCVCKREGEYTIWNFDKGVSKYLEIGVGGNRLHVAFRCLEIKCTFRTHRYVWIDR